MVESVKSRAEEKFAAIQKKDQKALKEKKAALQSRAEHMASLRSLRLAKEAADKEIADKEIADKEAAKKAAAKKKKSSRLPRAHRS